MDKKNIKVLILTSSPHPLIYQIKNELEKKSVSVILSNVLEKKKTFREILFNLPLILMNLKYLIFFTEIISKNYKSIGIYPAFKWYFHLVDLLILDKKYRFKIIDAHWIYPAGLIAVIYSKYIPKKVIITAHGYDADERTFEKPSIVELIKKICLKANQVFTAEKRLYNNLVGCGIDNVKLTNQFVELPESDYDILKIKKELNIPQKSFVIGFGPHLKKIYGLDDFVNAILLIKEDIPDLFVICIGDGELKNHVVKIFEKEKLRYKITGKIPQLEVIKHLMTCDIICNPGHVGQGIFTLESFSCSKPVIGYEDVNEVKIENNVTGLLTKSGNIKEFADLLLQLYQDSSLRKELGVNARRMIENQYSKDNRIKDILAAYRL